VKPRLAARPLRAAKHSKKRGMGTTLVCLLVTAKRPSSSTWVIAAFYVLRDGVLEQLTEDHTVYNSSSVARRWRASRSKAGAENAITRAVGVYEHVEPDPLVLDLTAGDRFLLCSDGLWAVLEEDLDGLGRRSQPGR